MSTYSRQDWALLIVRLVLGTVFIAHGSQKVLGIFGGPGLSGFAQWTAKLGAPLYLGYAAAFAEFIGGLMLFFGIAAEIGALLVVPVMVGAIWLVHLHFGYFVQNNGFEYPLNLLLLSLAVLVGGPGAYALYNPFKKIKIS